MTSTALRTNQRLTVRGETYRMVSREPSSAFGRYWIVLMKDSDQTLWMYLARQANRNERVPANARLVQR